MNKSAVKEKPPYETMYSSSIPPLKHRIRITDQVHLNPAYLQSESSDLPQFESVWIKKTKL